MAIRVEARLWAGLVTRVAAREEKARQENIAPRLRLHHDGSCGIVNAE
jgi:hypothetical protein